ncbi:TonB-dependent receptor plug domain-containing protein [Sphingosinicella terrae]|uniref:TonB-dependent receptor plug domain-containing protein n=1 Tax=Sphingosinicella terrae TaxID=2172047 RepID=UPI000E0D3444|nr:TonB-dependent receptor [Sphingosinicella terrae]
MRRTFPLGGTRHWRAALLASAAISVAGTARAQELDHQGLQDLFGESVTTSVTGQPQRASDAPAALLIITRDDIRRSPARDLVDLLRAYAGIDVSRWTANQSDVAVRGGVQPFNPRLLVLVNGRQVYLDHYGMTNWGSIGVELDEIQQIEVVKGPNSALFGFNAVSGVINIVTVNPLTTQRVTASADIGTEGYARLSGSAAFALGSDFGVRLSAGYSRWDELDALARSPLAPASDAAEDPLRLQVAGEVYGQLGVGTQAVLSGHYSETRSNDFLHVLQLNPSRQRFHAFGGRISHDLGWGVLAATAYRNASDIRGPISFPPFGLHLDNEVTVLSSKLVVPAGTSNTFGIGTEYRHNRLTQQPGYPGATAYDLLAVSGMWETAPTEALTLTLAGRVDHLQLRQIGIVDQPTIFDKTDFRRSITEWSLNSALHYQVDESTALRLVVARGLQAPSLFALASRFVIPTPLLPVVVAGDPSLSPSIVWSGEIGLSHRIEAAQIQLDVNAFFNRSAHIMSTPAGQMPPRATPPQYPFIFFDFDNVGSFRALGIEASAAHRGDNGLSWLLDYTWTESSQEPARQFQGIQLPLALDRATPEHKARVQLSYERGPWLGTVAARYNSATSQVIAQGSGLELTRLSQSLAVDAKLALQVGRSLSLELSGENLTDAASVDLSPVPSERRFWATVRATF